MLRLADDCAIEFLDPLIPSGGGLLSLPAMMVLWQERSVLLEQGRARYYFPCLEVAIPVQHHHGRWYLSSC